MTDTFRTPRDVEDGNWYSDARAAVRDASIGSRSDFNEFTVAERTNIINLSATYPLSQTRDIWQNVNDMPSEEQLYLSEGSDEISFVRSSERARYIPGYEAEVGVGVRIPDTDVEDGVRMRWGYFENDDDSFEGVGNAFYFGIDSDGVFVGKDDTKNEFSASRVYQENWNGDTLTGEGGPDNPSELELDASRGVISQIGFIYYGYGPVRMQFWVYDQERRSYEKVVAHTFSFPGRTSVEEINLPLRAEIVANQAASKDYELNVGGRQFSVVGQYTPQTRLRSHTRANGVSLSDTSWTTVISFRPKNNFENITARVISVGAFTDDDARFMVKKGTDLISSGASYSSPSNTDPSETAMEVTTDSANPNVGVKIAEGFMAGGQGGRQTITADNVDVTIGDREEVSLFMRNIQGSGSSKASIIRWEEEW